MLNAVSRARPSLDEEGLGLFGPHGAEEERHIGEPDQSGAMRGRRFH